MSKECEEIKKECAVELAEVKKDLRHLKENFDNFTEYLENTVIGKIVQKEITTLGKRVTDVENALKSIQAKIFVFSGGAAVVIVIAQQIFNRIITAIPTP